MSYTKTNWQTGDLITAELLNHSEQGIYDNSLDIADMKSSIPLIVNSTYDSELEAFVLSETWEDINNASFVLIRKDNVDNETGEVNHSCKPPYIIRCIESDNDYSVTDADGTQYNTDSPDGYPSGLPIG